MQTNNVCAHFGSRQHQTMKTILIIIIFIINLLSSVLISCAAFQVPPVHISLQRYRTSSKRTRVTLLANNDFNEEEEEEDTDNSKKNKLIACSASILLPFSEEVAFDYFSDLTRQP